MYTLFEKLCCCRVPHGDSPQTLSRWPPRLDSSLSETMSDVSVSQGGNDSVSSLSSSTLIIDNIIDNAATPLLKNLDGDTCDLQQKNWRAYGLLSTCFTLSFLGSAVLLSLIAYYPSVDSLHSFYSGWALMILGMIAITSLGALIFHYKLCQKSDAEKKEKTSNNLIGAGLFLTVLAASLGFVSLLPSIVPSINFDQMHWLFNIGDYSISYLLTLMAITFLIMGHLKAGHRKTTVCFIGQFLGILGLFLNLDLTNPFFMFLFGIAMASGLYSGKELFRDALKGFSDVQKVHEGHFKLGDNDGEGSSPDKDDNDKDLNGYYPSDPVSYGMVPPPLKK
jgi:hypothetical protein